MSTAANIRAFEVSGLGLTRPMRNALVMTSDVNMLGAHSAIGNGSSVAALRRRNLLAEDNRLTPAGHEVAYRLGMVRSLDDIHAEALEADAHWEAAHGGNQRVIDAAHAEALAEDSSKSSPEPAEEDAPSVPTHIAAVCTDDTCVTGDLCDLSILTAGITGYRETDDGDIPEWGMVGDPVAFTELAAHVDDEDRNEAAITEADAWLYQHGWERISDWTWGDTAAYAELVQAV